MAKRSIREIYNMLNKKREMALLDRERYYEAEHERMSPFNRYQIENLTGQVNAYTDIIILLETSGLVEDEQVDNEEAFKELFLK